MENETRKSFAIIIFILIGIIGLPAGIYQLNSRIQNGWICYSKHGHILETVSACKFNLFSGIFISAAALVIGLYQAWKRR